MSAVGGIGPRRQGSQRNSPPTAEPINSAGRRGTGLGGDVPPDMVTGGGRAGRIGGGVLGAGGPVGPSGLADDQPLANPQQRGPGGMPGAGGVEGRWPQYQNMSHDQLVQLNDEWFKKVSEQRRFVERWALLAVSFFLDQQYVDIAQINGYATHLFHIPKKKGRVRTVNNLVEGAVRMELARMFRNRPQGTVIPENEDASAYQAARAADGVLEHITREYDLEEIDWEAALWAIFAGTGIIDVQWDPEAGEMVEQADPRDPLEQDATATDPLMTAEEMLLGAPRMGPQGDFRFRALGPFEFGVADLRRRRMEDQPFVMVTKSYTAEEVFERWGVEVQADAQATFSTFDQRMTHIIQGGLMPNQGKGSFASGGNRSRAGDDEMVVVKETWIKPSFRAPDGLVLVTGGGEILDMQPWPSHYRGNYPFAKIEYIPVPSSFWGKGMVQAQIPLQRRHNRANSILIEQMNLRNSVSTAVPQGTKIRGALGGKATLYELPPGAQVQPNTIMPPDVGDLPQQEIELTRDAMSDITFQHEVSRGTTPPNVRSGAAISALKEADDTVVSLAIRSLERAIEHRGNHILSIVKDQWDQERMVKVIGENGLLESTAMLSGEDVGGHFHVQAGSAWPYSKSEKQQMVAQALEMGILGPEDAGRVLDMGGIRKPIIERDADHRHAKRENQQMEKLQEVDDYGNVTVAASFAFAAEEIAPEMWHNHEVHLYEHNLVRKSPEYEAWPVWKQQVLDAHIAGHEAWVYYMQQAAEGGQRSQMDPRIFEQMMARQAEQAAQAETGGVGVQDLAGTAADAAHSPTDQPAEEDGEDGGGGMSAAETQQMTGGVGAGQQRQQPGEGS